MNTHVLMLFILFLLNDNNPDLDKNMALDKAPN